MFIVAHMETGVAIHNKSVPEFNGVGIVEISSNDYMLYFVVLKGNYHVLFIRVYG